MAEYASKGVAGAGLGTGIAGLALGVANSGLLNGVFGGWNNGWGNGVYGAYPIASENMPVNRYELGLEKDLAAKDSKIALLESTIYTDGKLNELRNYMERKFDHVEHELCEQKSFNTGTIATINCMRGDIAELLSLTKRIIPKESICPEYMQRYNSWVAPTTTAQENPAAAG